MGSSSTRRVVITGTGLISPLGNTNESLWNALSTGRSGVGPLQGVPADHLPTSYAAEAADFTGHINDFGPLEKDRKKAIRKGLKIMCREIQMGIAAAQLALADANLGLSDRNPDRTGVVYGCDYLLTVPDDFVDSVSHCFDDDRLFQFSQWAVNGLPRLAPLWLLKYLPNMPACYIAIYNDLRGPNNSITSREVAANLAMGEAFHTIARGSADVAVTGATGTRVHPLRTAHIVLQEELALNNADPAKLARPFDKNRTGMVLGEGAAALIFEELNTAKARGATILAEIVGQGSSTVVDSDGVADHRTALVNSMRQALHEAGMTPEEVGHVHAHGLGTRQCDIEEAQAIDDVFGSRARPVPVVAAKSYFGNLGAGSGAVEMIASLLAMQHGRLFPVLNYETPDPDCPVAAVTSENAPPGDSVLNLNVTGQGQAGAVLVRAYR